MNKYINELNWVNNERSKVGIKKSERMVKLNNLMMKMACDGRKTYS